MNKAQFLELGPISEAEDKLRDAREQYARANGWVHMVDKRTSLWLWCRIAGADRFGGAERYTAPTVEQAVRLQIALNEAGAGDKPTHPARNPAELELELGIASDRADQFAALVREAIDLFAPMIKGASVADWITRAQSVSKWRGAR